MYAIVIANTCDVNPVYTNISNGMASTSAPNLGVRELPQIKRDGLDQKAIRRTGLPQREKLMTFDEYREWAQSPGKIRGWTQGQTKPVHNLIRCVRLDITRINCRRAT